MRIIIHPLLDRHAEVDVTHRLVAAIAHELWSLYGGNEQLNWLEAEHHLERLVALVRAEAEHTVVVPAGLTECCTCPSPPQSGVRLPASTRPGHSKGRVPARAGHGNRRTGSPPERTFRARAHTLGRSS